MDWKLLDAIKETEHPYLNYYTLIYEVKTKDNTFKTYSYYIASRHDENHLLSKNNEAKPDGVLILTYLEKNGTKYAVLTKQFRPALNRYVYSIPAGLVDDNEDVITAAKREVSEEVGGKVENIELLFNASPTSSGLSDELNAVCIAKVSELEKEHLEEFEDIQHLVLPFNEVEIFLKDKFVALQARSLLLYLVRAHKF